MIILSLFSGIFSLLSLAMLHRSTSHCSTGGINGLYEVTYITKINVQLNVQLNESSSTSQIRVRYYKKQNVLPVQLNKHVQQRPLHGRGKKIEMKTQLIGEFRQQDGWHAALLFSNKKEAQDWIHKVDESHGHHHARRYRRVKIGSSAWDAAIERERGRSESDCIGRSQDND